MDTRLLEYFLAIAREENITKAAESLHITQPTLSRQIHDLEKDLGKTLFNRTGRKTTLTQDGEIFKKRAEEILTLVQKAKEELSSTNTQLHGSIHIGAGETYQMKQITDLLSTIHQEHPSVTYRLYSGVADDVLEKVDTGLLDFALVFEPVQKEKYNFIEVPSYDQMGVLMCDDHPLARKDQITYDDLYQMELLVSTRSEINDTAFVSRLKNNSAMHIIGSFNLIYNASLMVSSHLGQAITIKDIAPRLPHLIWKPITPEINAKLVLIWKKYEVMTPLHQLFLDEIRKLYSQA